jgi:putative protease
MTAPSDPSTSATSAPAAVSTVRPELLAPAGDWECARAAVENGADAIYFGLERFNARMRARNFTVADLPELMSFLHRRGVRGYVTFNTLVFQNELAQAEEYLRAIITAGVDAAIVQDVGICRLIRRLSPDFPIHGSTQMTVTSPAGVDFARSVGCDLVVLARENSLKEIGLIQEALRAAGTAFPLEVFVHGALCVAYSGQCLTSEALGGRSANRGECAQACRMPYELVSDGKTVPLGDRKYLLSPQDLAGLEILPDLIAAGVRSLKIEGRLKSPEYVAAITRVYRSALDRLTTPPGPVAHSGQEVPRPPAASPGSAQSSEAAVHPVSAEDQYDMEMSFSRGLFSGWFRGVNNQALVHARFGTKRGVHVGDVTRVLSDRVVLRLAGAIKAGDGVVFDSGRPAEKEEGGRVFTVRTDERGLRSDEAVLTFGRDHLDLGRVQTGAKVWKTSDPELDRRIRQTFVGEQVRFQRPIRIEVHGRAGSPMTILLHDEEGHVVRGESAVPLAPAEKQPLTTERLREQLGRLGGTPFRLGELENHLEGAVIVPVSELNRLRRDAATALEQARAQPKRWTLLESSSARAIPGKDASRESTERAADKSATGPELLVLVRDLAQLDQALQCGVQTIYCEFEDPKKYREAVRTVHEASGCEAPGRTIWVAPPRISKPGEDWILRLVRSSDADGYLVRNPDQLRFFADCRRIGDFSLNVANALAAEFFRTTYGLERLTASYDLNAHQLEALLLGSPASWFEVTIHQHMPMFHMEHCVFCAFLSNGTDFTNCGRPCDRHDVRLRDRTGAEHVLKADAGCRNTVFNAAAQTGAEYVGRLLALGLRHFRIEFVSESPSQVATTIARYRQLLRGEIAGSDLWRELKVMNQLGVTRGTLAG